MLKSLWNRIKNLNKLFIWIVLIPTGLSILYFGLIASHIYISEARFVVYSPNQRVSSSGLASLLSNLGGSNSTSAAQTISSFIASWDGMMAVNKLYPLKQIFGNSDIDIFNRFGGKLAMEHMVRTFGERLPIVMTRPFNYTGVGQDEKFLIPKIVSHFRRRAPAIELGNLDVSRDFSDVRDVVAIYAHLLLDAAAEVCGQTFNVCSGQAYSLREIMALVEQISGHHLEVRINPAFVRANEVPRLLGSAARLQAHLGPLTHISMDQTLGWMLEN